MSGTFDLVIQWETGEREIRSRHDQLETAAREAFRLADELSIPDKVRDATEVAILRGDKLELSIAIIPGERLSGND